MGVRRYGCGIGTGRLGNVVEVKRGRSELSEYSGSELG